MKQHTLILPTSKDLASCAQRQDEFMKQHMLAVQAAHTEFTTDTDPKLLEFAKEVVAALQVWGLTQQYLTGEMTPLHALLGNAVITGIWHGILLHKQYLLEQEQGELEKMLEVSRQLDKQSQFNPDCCPNCKSIHAVIDQGVWRCKECHTLWTWKPSRKEGE